MRASSAACRIIVSAALVLFCVASQPVSQQPVSQQPVSQDEPEAWPRQIDHPRGTIVVYQPQIDDYIVTTLKARMAVSVTLTGKTEPTFGAIWCEAGTVIDRDTRIVTFEDVKVTRVRFPGATPAQEKDLAAIVEDAALKWDLSLDYDRFVASLAALRQSQQSSASLKNDPPVILVEKAPAMLLLYDGAPQSRELTGSSLKRVVNTPSVVLFDPVSKSWYLYGGSGWFAAADPLGPWAATTEPSPAVAALVKEMETKAEQAAQEKGEVTTRQDEKVLAEEAKKEDPKLDPARPPRIIAVTKPTELLVFDGEPTWKPLTEGEVLYADNTSSDLLLEVATQQHYLLISGRWYRAKSLEGPWAFVRGDALPVSFASIPEDSAKGDLLAHVAGTPQAAEAVADATMPQVAAVKRGPAKLEVPYDGEPKFEQIAGTTIAAAKNSSMKVLRVGAMYYVCEQAIWYVSVNPQGPWEVAESVPDEVLKIPPESAAYNVKYVSIYDTTPEYVYFGYTPAYLGCYPYYGTVVWGTGYWYAPWVGSIYYPSPWTYGFNAHYNPYYGWSFGFGVGWAFGWGTVSIGWSNWGWGGYYPPAYWGPGGFYPVYRPPYYPGGHPPHYGNRPTPYGSGGRPSTLPSQPGGRPSTLPSQPGGRPSTLPAQSGGQPSTRPAGGGSSGNIYERPANRDKVAPGGGGSRPSTLAGRPGAGSNDIFAGDGGDVYRRNSNGSWDQRSGNSWQRSGGASSSLQRDYSSRQRGSARAGGYTGGGRAGGRRR